MHSAYSTISLIPISTYLPYLLNVYPTAHQPTLHSFPTRRSSDLERHVAPEPAGTIGEQVVLRALPLGPGDGAGSLLIGRGGPAQSVQDRVPLVLVQAHVDAADHQPRLVTHPRLLGHRSEERRVGKE